MIKKELIKQVSQKTRYAQKDISSVVDATIATITEALQAGEPVKLVGFGTFEAVEIAERECTDFQNPGKKVTVPAHKAPKFRPSDALKTAVK